MEDKLTREQVEQLFPFGAWYIQDNDSERTIQLGPFEFEDEEPFFGTAWSHPNKAFHIDFSRVQKQGDGFLVHIGNDQSVFIRPASEAAWDKLKPRLEE